MPKIPVKKDTKSDPVLDTLKSIEQQLISINSEVTDTSDTALKQNSHLEELVKNLHTSTPEKVSKEKAVNTEVEAIKKAVEEERLQRLRDRNAADKKKDEDDAAARMVKLKSAEEDLKIKQVRLQTATQRLADMQELAQERARILAERAKQKLQEDKKDPARNYGPVAALGRGVNAVRTNQPGTLSRAVTMALTGGIGNIFGLDKVLDATAGGIGKLAGNVIGTPFKALAKKRQEKKADKEAIRQAIHDAELQKRIQNELKARGLSESQNEKSENTENVPTEKPKGRPKKNQKQIPGGTNLKGKSKGEAKKGSGTTADRKKNPMKGVEDRLDKIDNTLKKLSKPKAEEKKKEGKGIFDMLLSALGFLWNGVKTAIGAGFNMLMSGLSLVLGGVVRKGLGLAWKGLKAGSKFAWKGLKSGGKLAWDGIKAAGKGIKTLATKAAPAVKTGLSKAASGISNFAKGAWNSVKTGVSKVAAPVKKVVSKAVAPLAKAGGSTAGKALGAVAKKAYLLDAVIGGAEDIMAVKEKGGEAVLDEKRKKGLQGWDWISPYRWGQQFALATGVDKAAGWGVGKIMDMFLDSPEEMIAKSRQHLAEMNAKKNGTTVEQELAILDAQDANRKQRLAEKEAEHQVLNIKEKDEETLLNKQHLDTTAATRKNAKKDKEIGSVHESTAKEYEEMTKLTSAMHTWAENDDMYAIEITKDLFTNSGQLSEEGILILKRQGVTDQQMQQIQNTINNSTNNNGSNIYQTNVTQHNDTGVYATGDAARTMTM